MNTPNSLEEQMRGWVPRRPSPEIEKQLFGVEPRGAAVASRSRPMHLTWWQTLSMSAAACAALVFTLLNVAHFTASGGTSGSSLLSLSNGSCVVSLAMASAPRNTWNAPILGWTNEGAFGSTHRSFDLLNTNRLLH